MSSSLVDVSVVIPTFNRSDLLAETVGSVLAQTRRPREIIVVDNGTVHVAAAALARFGDAVRLIVEQPLGKQVARNTGIAAATSTWIATLDDDDLYRPIFLEQAEGAMRDGRADIIGADHRKFSRLGTDPLTNFEHAPADYWAGLDRPEPAQGWSYVGRFPRERLLRRVPFYPSTMLVRRELALQAGGYDPRMRGIMAEDLEYLVRILGMGDLAILWEPLVDYRLHPGNDTASRTGQEIGRWRIFEFVRDTHPTFDQAFADALADDLPIRRRRIFDLAYGVGDRRAMADAAARLAPDDWTTKRRLCRMLATLPRPMAEVSRRLHMRATGRAELIGKATWY